MCTLSFSPQQQGYVVAMNRDERLTRGDALAPRTFTRETLSAIYPHEPEGGTWIASNESGITLALLNWNISRNGGEKQRSRGILIPHLIHHSTADDVVGALAGVDLIGLLPFRLVGIFPESRLVREFRWDGCALHLKAYDWEARHWFSSGWGDDQAAERRGAAIAAARTESDAGSLAWLGRLHRSHIPEPGAFSICVHRKDASTLSYTEIEVTGSAVNMRYQAGQPCQPAETAEISLPLRIPNATR